MRGESEACFVRLPQVKEKFPCTIIVTSANVINHPLKKCNQREVAFV